MTLAAAVKKVRRALCLNGQQAGPDTRRSPPGSPPEPPRPSKQHQSHAAATCSSATGAKQQPNDAPPTLPNRPQVEDFMLLSVATDASTSTPPALHLPCPGSSGIVATLEHQQSAQLLHELAQSTPFAAGSAAAMLPTADSHAAAAAAVIPGPARAGAATVGTCGIQLLHAPAAPQGVHLDLPAVRTDQTAPSPPCSGHLPAAGEDIHAASSASPCGSPTRLEPSTPGGPTAPLTSLMGLHTSAIRAPALTLPGLDVARGSSLDLPLAPHRHGALTCPSSPLSPSPSHITRSPPSPSLLRHATAYDAMQPAALFGKHSYAECEAAAAPPSALPAEQLQVTPAVSFPEYRHHPGPAGPGSQPPSLGSLSNLPRTCIPTAQDQSVGREFLRSHTSAIASPVARYRPAQSSRGLAGVAVAGVERSFGSAIQPGSLPGRHPSAAGQRGTEPNMALTELRESLSSITSRSRSPRPSSGLEGLAMILQMYASLGGRPRPERSPGGSSQSSLNRAALLQGSARASGTTSPRPLHHHLSYTSRRRSQPPGVPRNFLEDL